MPGVLSRNAKRKILRRFSRPELCAALLKSSGWARFEPLFHGLIRDETQLEINIHRGFARAQLLFTRVMPYGIWCTPLILKVNINAVDLFGKSEDALLVMCFRPELSI